MRGAREKGGAIDGGKETFTFFFGAESPFSQWHPAEFEVEGVVYNCAEQYMMHRKAGRCVRLASQTMQTKCCHTDSDCHCIVLQCCSKMKSWPSVFCRRTVLVSRKL